jgi:D-inositol-3-phosphate glycosyltransferase
VEAAVLTGGADKPYAFGLAKALMAEGVPFDLIGNDDLDCAEFRNQPNLKFLNLRGDQRSNARYLAKATRVLRYYRRLILYVLSSKPKLFHILWNNKFEYFDRTVLMLAYRLLGKKIVLTLHNVNARRRDGGDSLLNRATLRIQYRLAHHLFVHTEKMRQDLMEEFGECRERVSVIPFGINNAVPITGLSARQAKQRLAVADGRKTILFFGNIAPYKGLEYLIEAFRSVRTRRSDCRLMIVGRPKNCEGYWSGIRDSIREMLAAGQILLEDRFVPDEEVETYFKAADVLVLPYRYIYQSGVLFLGYSFGLPVLAADVGSLKDEIVEGRTGFTFKPENAPDLATTIERYFDSELFADLDNRRKEISDFAAEEHSWAKVAEITLGVYADLLHLPAPGESARRESAKIEPSTRCDLQ